MSTRSTILLSDSGEHWYHDCSDDTFVLEFDTAHPMEDIDEDGGVVVVAKGTALHKALSEMRMKLITKGGHP